MQKKTTLTRLRLFFGKMLPLLIMLSFSLSKIIAQPYVNGTLSTGTTTVSGVTSPAGYTWSECQNPTGNTTVANTTAGIAAQIASNTSAADDFTVPSGVGWALTKVTVYGYSTGAAPTPSPFNDIRIRIHRGVPGAPGTIIVYGDLTTNRFTASNDALMYRIFNTVVTPATAPNTTRKIWTIEANISVTLGPGVYWLEYQIGNPASNFTPLSSPIGVRTLPGYNAMQGIAGAFNPYQDPGQGPAASLVNTEMPFTLDYSVVAAPACIPITGANIFAPNIIFNESFDGTIPAAGWPIQNNSSPIGVITWNQGGPVGVFAPHSGAGFASVNFNSGGGLATISNWMLSPSVTLNNGDQFKFWTRASTGGGVFPDRLQVRMSTSGTSTNVGTSATDVGDFTTLLLDINPTYSTTAYPEVWTEYTVTVSGVPAAGIGGRMAFRYFVEGGGPAGGNSNYIGIDDARYIGSGSPTICAGGNGNIAVTVTGGLGPFTVTYNANPGGNTTITNYTSGNNIPVSPTVTTTYTLVSVTGFDGCVSTNNTGSATINTISGSTAAVLSEVLLPPVPTVVFSQGFDIVAPLPAGWASQNLSLPIGLTGWFQGNAAVFPSQSGAATAYIAANFNNTSALATISNWLFAPAVTLRNGDVFTFWTRTTTGTFPDRLQVRMNKVNNGLNVGATNTSVGDYTDLLLDINPTYTATGYPTAWTQFTITLSGLPATGTAGRLAFRYFVEGGGPPGTRSDYIGIDNVVYTSTLPGAPPTTCTGSTTNLKVDITGGSSPYTVVINRTPGGLLPPITGYVSGAYIPVTPAVTTTYNLVSVTSSIGCLGTGNSGTPTVTVLPATVTPIMITDNPTGPLCAGDPKLLTVTGAGGATTFSNLAPILAPANTGTCSGIGGPYPATIAVSGLPVTGVTVSTVKLNNMNHTWTADLDIVLQHPNGTQNVILLSDFGGSNDLANTTLTFSDAAPATVTNLNPIPSGTYRCTNTAGPDTWPAPGPPTITQINPLLSTFTGDMNGTWRLFINDQAGGDCGNINGGFEITFVTPPAPPPVGWSFLWTPAAGLSSTTTNPVAASPMSTTTYTVMGTAPGGCQTTAAITITVNDRPAVTAQPANVTACVGSTATFTAAGTGTGVAYQWQVSTNGGGLYTNIPVGAPYSGVNSPTLTINPVSATMNNYRYRLVVSGTCPPAANSNGAILTVNGLPVVSITPAGPVCGGVPGISGTLLSTGSQAPPIPGTVTVNSGNINLAIPDGPATWPQTLFPGVKTPDLAVSGIPANATITGMSVKLNLPHTYIADMVIVLKAPNGDVLNLDANISQTGGAGANFVNTVISSAVGANALGSGTPPYTGTFRPDAAGATYTINFPPAITFPGGPTSPAGYIPTVSTFPGLYSIPNGNYSLGIYDWGAGDLGTLTNWEITIDYTTPGGTGTPLTFTWSPAAGLYTNPTATTPYVAGSQTSNVYAAPTVNTIYTATGTDGTTGCSNTATVSVIYTPAPPTVSPAAPPICLGSIQPLTITSSPSLGVWTPNGPTGSLYSNAAGTIFYTGTPTTTVYAKPSVTTTYNVSVTGIGPDGLQTFTNPAPIVIPTVLGPGNPYPSNLVVSGLPTTGVSVKSVTITGISHTWSEDVDILLQSPTGQNVILISDIAPGGSDYVNHTYTLDDAAATTMAGATPPPSGTYKPTNSIGVIGVEPDNWPAPGPGTVAQPTPALSMFGNTADPNGTWKLFVMDDAGLDGGNISGGYSITFSYPTVGCTSPDRSVTVTVNNPATITTEPVNATVCTDKVATFSVVATGTALTYQWWLSTDNGNNFTIINNGGVYSGATTPTLVITAPPVSMNSYQYRVIVQGAAPCPADTSVHKELFVNPLPTVIISANPYTRLRPGLTTTITSSVSPPAAANGFVWLRNGVAVPGANLASLVVGIDALGDYSLRVTDVNGCTNTSNVISITDTISSTCFIYPNPNSGMFQVRYYSALNNVLPRTLTVYDAKGEQVLVKTYTIGRPYDRMDVDLRKNGKGLYWVEIGDANGKRITMCRVAIQ